VHVIVSLKKVIATIGEVKKEKAAAQTEQGGENSENSMGEDRTCKICMDKPIDSIILNCGMQLRVDPNS